MKKVTWKSLYQKVYIKKFISKGLYGKIYMGKFKSKSYIKIFISRVTKIY